MVVLLRGPIVRRELPALAAKLRAFSSLLSLPSHAQSVIKAFRRQGIGYADVVNTARFLLSRLESLFAAQKVFQIFRGRAEARLCDLFRSAVASLHKSHRLAIVRIKVVGADVLSDCHARAGKTLISRPNLSASGSCRALRACLLWHLPSVSASAVADAKTAVKHHRPTHIRPLEPHHKCTLISRPTAVHHGYIYIESVRRYSCYFTALLPMCIRLT